jgi:uncharacterized membrane protein YjgN (DUF898 family)
MDAHVIEFHGSGSEYFRVWVVNIALTIATLGVYSAWAKVRNKQYFYGNSFIAGASFEYTANPLNILKGRVLVLMVFVTYNAASVFQPAMVLVLAALIIPLVPWIIVNAVKFNHRHSSYRNLRFHFDATYWEGFKIYILWTFAIALSFGLAYPFVIWRRKKFLVERSRFGNGRFLYHSEVGFFYLIYILAGVIYTSALFVLALVLTGGVALFGADILGGDTLQLDDQEAGLLGAVIAAFTYLGFFALFVVFNTGIQAAISNYVWSNTRLNDLRFEYSQSIPRVVWLQFSNIVAIILSLGLLIPWAKVRMTRYRLSKFLVHAPQGALQQFIATERDYVVATGDEFGEAFDIDLGL